ncbi:MAG: PTS IIA-like nitrogen regulatory protein PtsN [Sulfuricellaceae bacterium]|jgi:PTS system nitrogen regulatory IIA component
MSLVSGILPAANVVVGLDVASKKRAFEQVGELLEGAGRLNRNTVFDSLFAREKLGSTGLGEGIAIPHGRIKGLLEAVGALIKLKEPIPFDAPDGKPVALMFVLLVPEQATDMHLQILGELAQMFSDKALREKMLACDDAAELHQLVVGWSP